MAQRALAKLALGSHQLYDEFDMDEYLKQLEAGRKNVGRVAELFRTHPYLPKRTEALRLFAQSAFYRRQVGLDGGITKAELDSKVAEIVKVL